MRAIATKGVMPNHGIGTGGVPHSGQNLDIHERHDGMKDIPIIRGL